MTFGVDKQGRRETNPVICDEADKNYLFFLQVKDGLKRSQKDLGNKLRKRFSVSPPCFEKRGSLKYFQNTATRVVEGFFGLSSLNKT